MHDVHGKVHDMHILPLINEFGWQLRHVDGLVDEHTRHLLEGVHGLHLLLLVYR